MPLVLCSDSLPPPVPGIRMHTCILSQSLTCTLTHTPIHIHTHPHALTWGQQAIMRMPGKQKGWFLFQVCHWELDHLAKSFNLSGLHEVKIRRQPKWSRHPPLFKLWANTFTRPRPCSFSSLLKLLLPVWWREGLKDSQVGTNHLCPFCR